MRPDERFEGLSGQDVTDLLERAQEIAHAREVEIADQTREITRLEMTVERLSAEVRLLRLQRTNRANWLAEAERRHAASQAYPIDDLEAICD